MNAQAFDIPVPGYNIPNCISKRLCKSRPANEFDLQSYNEGNYFGATI
jgi:starch phosphorylase